MVDYPTLEGADPREFDRAAEESAGLAREIESMVEELSALVPELDGEYGEDSETISGLRTRITTEIGRLRDGQLALRTIEGSLRMLGDSVRHGRMELADAREQADKFADVDYSQGTITLSFTKVPEAKVDVKRFARYKAGLRDVANRMMDARARVNTSDNDAAADIAKKSPLLVRSGPHRVRSPYENHGWWSGRSASERHGLIESDPERVGGPDSDGIPSPDRSAANERLLDQRIRNLEEAAACGSGAAAGLLAVLRAVRHRLRYRDGREGDGERAYLLLIGPEDSGRVVLAIGNPDTADHVIVHIPGTGASLPKLEVELARVERMVADANLFAPSHTAGVLWLGYDAPSSLLKATTKRCAKSATRPLPRFLTGLRAVRRRHTGRLGVTVMGHSYGTVAIGFTVREHQVAADQLVLVASPGIGVKSAAQLRIDKDDVYATTAPNDIIRRVPGFVHGRSPADEAFGARVFPSPRHEGSQLAAHSAYWMNDNPVRRDFAAIITGNGDLVAGGDWIQTGPWSDDEAV